MNPSYSSPTMFDMDCIKWPMKVDLRLNKEINLFIYDWNSQFQYNLKRNNKFMGSERHILIIQSLHMTEIIIKF